jgi:ketosteroid isomerase-like protein|tara:strand:- start:449 stop:925 length:477 start_codon:yes stop_codon:yes gene_type:complete
MKALLIAFVTLLTAPAFAEDLTEADRAELQAVDAAYVSGWLQNGTPAQEAAIMPLFADDAVIMPGRGLEPRTGMDEIRGFWFPDGYPPTQVLEFSHDIAGINGNSHQAVIHGRSFLHFEYNGIERRQGGNYLIVARQHEGEWLISHMIWNDIIYDDED